jgi:hypothetical protein
MCSFANPPLKPMHYEKCNRFGHHSSCPFPTQVFSTLLALPSPNHILGMFALANFFVQEEGLTPCIMRAQPFCFIGPHFLANKKFLIHRIHKLEHFELECQSNITSFQTQRCIRQSSPQTFFEVCGSLFNELPHFFTNSTIFSTIVIRNNGTVKIHIDMILVPI